MGLKNLLLGVCIGVLVCIAVAMFMSGGMADPVGFVNKIIIHDPGNSTRVYYTGNETVINVVAPTPQPTTQPTPMVIIVTPEPTTQPTPIIVFVTPTPQSTPPQIPTIPPSIQPTPTPQPTATPTPTPTPQKWEDRANQYEYMFMNKLYWENNTMCNVVGSPNSEYKKWITLLAGEAADRDLGVDNVNVTEFNVEWPNGPAPNTDPYHWIMVDPATFVQGLQAHGLVRG